VSITGGAANGAANQANGGKVTIKGGAGGASNANGGDVIIAGGAGGGTGTKGNVAFAEAALSTSATGGFTCLPTCAGAPTGTPASVPTGCVPVVVDTTNSKLYIYISSTWKSVTLT
jgi:hypothetical protein